MTLWQTLFGFDGRIGRMTFWLSALAVVLIDLSVVVLASGWVHSAFLADGAPHRPDGSVVGVGFLLLLVTVISIWAAVALKVKRCHDRGRSGWWVALALTGIGALWLLYDLGFQPGAQRRNRFGEAPGAAPAEPLAEVVPPPAPAPPDSPPPTTLSEPVHEPESAPPVAAVAAAADEPIHESVPAAPIVAAQDTHPPEAPPAVIEASAAHPEPDEPAVEHALESEPREAVIEPEPAPVFEPPHLETDHAPPAAAPEGVETPDVPHAEHPAPAHDSLPNASHAEHAEAEPPPAVTQLALPAANEAH